jgi:hypothetical protein
MKKRLNEEEIKNELSEGSIYFRRTISAPQKNNSIKENPLHQKTNTTMPPSNHDTVIPRDHETMLEDIRKAMKAFGKEAATHRFTIPEKQDLAEIIYAYKQLGVRTSENEITRIAINFIIKEFQLDKEESILDTILKLLNN